ncbi:ankyrin repeat domain-containing protein [Roseimaritima ulvae]|uniref:ankyrin repeat domain-containing protein n=1 Tax=Roseimaritima ulvae TaxID=980254 RepID=UPI0011CE7DE3|nr:ankyrin repeat domain-containing protein [Roseimaritima ulvae]
MDDDCLYCGLSYAADAGDHEAVTRYLNLGASPAVEVECNNALAYAIGREHIDIVRLLLNSGADPNRSDPMIHATPMTLAVDRRSQAIVQLLIAHGAKLDDINMFVVVRSGTQDFVQEMIDLGACASVIDMGTGRTLLHDAAMYGHERTVAALVRAGVDTLRTDRWGNTATDLAARNGHCIVVQLLASFDHKESSV